MPSMDELWRAEDETVWRDALKRYWKFVDKKNLEVEEAFDSLDANKIRNMDSREWYDFLLNRYFKWKYTAANRYASTTNYLIKYLGPDDNLENLFQIKEEIFNINKEDVIGSLQTAKQIRGLGVAGASGLLAVLFPAYFATVDQFAVKALQQVPELPKKAAIAEMNPDQLSINDGVILINIMKEKARSLNAKFKRSFWTPRKIDMVLWQCGRKERRQLPLKASCCDKYD